MDFDAICRCCLANNKPLFSIYNGKVVNSQKDSVAFMINQITSVKPELDDKLPDKACISCTTDVRRFYNFKIKCEKSNRTLQQLFSCAAKDHLESPLNISETIPKTQELVPPAKQIRANQDDYSILNKEKNTLKETSSYGVNSSIQLPPLEISIKQECIENDTTSYAVPEINIKQEYDDSNDCSKEINVDKEKTQDNSAALSTNLIKDAQVKFEIYEYNETNSISNPSFSHVDYEENNADSGNHWEKNLSTNNELINHLESHAKQYTCVFCNTVFNDHSTLSRHILEHTVKTRRSKTSAKRYKEKLYSCKHCPKRCFTCSELKYHLRTHTGEKPFKCNYCDKRFTQAGARNIHERIHSGYKPFKCNYCDKSFARISICTIHERIHTGEEPFKCRYCDKRFTQDGVRICHERIHTGERPYKCSYCDKRFKQVGARISHERIHTGEKPFKCNYCDKSFARTNIRTVHERTHTGKKY